MSSLGKGDSVTTLRLSLLGVAAGMLLFGILTKGYFDVWVKAIAICMECIGIG